MNGPCTEETMQAIHEDLEHLEQLSVFPASQGAITPLQAPISRIRARLVDLEAAYRGELDRHREDRYLVAAAMDGITGTPLRILRLARRRLSPVQPRPLPLRDLCRELEVGHSIVHRALNRLVRSGYLLRATTGSLHEGNPYAYRLGSPTSLAA